MIKVTVWNEFVHEQNEPDVAKVHPNGIHATLAEFLSKEEDFTVRTCTLHDPEHGLTQEVLDDTDVLIWWGHKSHNKVEDEIVERVYKRVIGGMGLIALHSAHHSKIFKKLMGTTCNLRWRHGARCRVWVVKPSHPIAQGVDETFSLPQEEMYGEPFDVPNPDDVVFMSWFNGGEVFRSGCTWTRGNGKIFHFQPGHELYPSFSDKNVQQVIKNAIRWAKPTINNWIIPVHKVPPMENIEEAANDED